MAHIKWLEQVIRKCSFIMSELSILTLSPYSVARLKEELRNSQSSVAAVRDIVHDSGIPDSLRGDVWRVRFTIFRTITS